MPDHDQQRRGAMQLNVVLLPQLLGSECSETIGPETLGVVIDTLRFTTTACVALQHARSIRVASEVDEAWALRSQANSESPLLLCGERHCRPIEGFDLGNSPLEYGPEVVAERELVFTTTNGTRAVQALQETGQVWLASLVNRKATARALCQENPCDVVVVCSGTEGVVSLEDCLAAGALVEELQGNGNDLQLNDSALLCLQAWQAIRREAASREALEQPLYEALVRAIGGRNLLASGYQKDVRFAAQIDSIDVVPKSRPARGCIFTAEKDHSRA